MRQLLGDPGIKHSREHAPLFVAALSLEGVDSHLLESVLPEVDQPFAWLAAQVEHVKV